MDIRTVTVVGAGNMGSGIAQSWAQAGCTVRMHDVSAEAIQRGMDRIEAPLRKRVAAGKMDPGTVERLMANLHAAPELEAAVRDADLVVEAVFEDLKVKQDLFSRLDPLCRDHTVFATNTSSLRVQDLAAVTGRADRFVGLHYFFPAAINKLVEVVRTPDTSDEVFGSVFEAAKGSGKVPIETADAYGFCVNRFFVPWINESCRLLEEGVADIPTIEAAAKEAFGITMGPFELMNVTGVPISLHAQSTLHQAFGPFYEPAPALRRKVDEGGTWDLSGTPSTDTSAVVARLRGVVFGIACHLVDEGVASIRDTDRGATIGLRWAKGPYAMMNAQGLEHALAEVRAIHERWGDAFPEPGTLGRLAGAGEAWHLPAVIMEREPGGHVATVTFDRPEALNALDTNVLTEFGDIVQALHDDPPRALVVTGSGKAFVAGADIPTMKRLDPQGARDYTRFGNDVFDRLASLPCPVLMAINGHCLGGGLELALCGDLLYASENAVLGLPEVGLGIHPGFGGTQRLPRRIGVGPAKEMVYTGRTLDAEEALAVGLVEAVHPAGALMDRVLATAHQIAQKAPLAVQGAKHSIDQGLGMDLQDGLAIEQESVLLLFATKDKDEGLGAFLERRRPVFRGA